MKRRQSPSGFEFVVLATMIVAPAITFNRQNYSEKIATQELLTGLEAENVASAVLKLNKETPTGKLILLVRDGKEKQLYRSDMEATETLLLEHGISYGLENVPQENYLLTIILPVIISAVVLMGLFMFINARAAGSSGANAKIMNFGKSRAKMSKEAGKADFKKVTGLQEEKEDLGELVDFPRSPQKCAVVGTRIPKGMILVDPPGAGRTLLAKAAAGETGVPFLSISGSDFVEVFVDVGVSGTRDLLGGAKKNAPCIVFIDEINTVAKRRGTDMDGGHDERERALSQLLVEMDSFGVNEGTIVMAATNRVGILGPAILRPGRFDRKIRVGRPDVKGREEILEACFKEKSLGEDMDLNRMARTTSGFTGADLESLLDEAAIVTVREGHKSIQQANTDHSFVKMGVGAEEHSRVISEKEKKITAYHETGHAMLFHVPPDVGPIHTISIIPAGMGAVGYTMPLPENGELFNSKGKILQNIMASLGGRITGEIIFGDVTTRVSQDIKQATSIVRAMVTRYGMSNKVGMINYDSDNDKVFIGKDLACTESYGEHMASAIDSGVRRIIGECYEKAKAITQEHASVLRRCMGLLIEKEKIEQEEFESLSE